MKVWISKYALTQGIFEFEGETGKEDRDFINHRDKHLTSSYYGENKEWHFKKEDAIKKAEVMRLKKIDSLKKQLFKLENMKFD